MGISVVILSYNSAAVLAETIVRARLVSDDIHVVDSFSTDDSVAIAGNGGAKVVQREFIHYGEQRNWAIANLPLHYEWQLHLDADERLNDELVAQLNQVKSRLPKVLSGSDISGYLFARRTMFMGRALRYGGFFPIWHLRLFHGTHGRCEDRLYDQHFMVDGLTAMLPGEMIDDMQLSLSDWTARHNRWSDLEVIEQLKGESQGRIKGDLQGNAIERKRALREWYQAVPLFLRPFLLFFYRYLIRGGFLDGRAGLVYCVLQTFWYRFLIDAKLYEASLVKNSE